MTDSSASQPLIRQASIEDFDELKELLHAANKYSITQSGVPQWAAIDYAFAELHQQLGDGQCFVIRDADNEITSAIVINESTRDWGAKSQDGQALYFYKLMKNPVKALPGEGSRLLAFAASEAQKRHKSFLRCDTITESPELVDYYKKLGFKDKGRFIYESSGRVGILLESDVADVLEKAGRKTA